MVHTNHVLPMAHIIGSSAGRRPAHTVSRPVHAGHGEGGGRHEREGSQPQETAADTQLCPEVTEVRIFQHTLQLGHVSCSGCFAVVFVVTITPLYSTNVTS